MITGISQSMVNMLYRCPYQFYLRHVKNILMVPGIAARKGSSVHAGAERAHRYKAETGKNVALDEVQDATRDRFVKLVKEEGVLLTDEEKENKNEVLNNSLNEAINTATAYCKNIVPSYEKIGLIEERLYADLGLGLPMEGTPDLVVDGTAKDLKTAGKRWSEGDENKEIQPDFYKILLKHNGFPELPFEYIIMSNLKNEPKEMPEGAIYDKEYGVYCDRRLVQNRNGTGEKRLILRVKASIQMIKSGNFPPCDPKSYMCTPKFCGYWGICKYCN